VDAFNKRWADWLGIQIELVGWEDTFKRWGRPQEQINLDLDRCEAFIGMLWRKWAHLRVWMGSIIAKYDASRVSILQNLSRYQFARCAAPFRTANSRCARPGQHGSAWITATTNAAVSYAYGATDHADCAALPILFRMSSQTDLTSAVITVACWMRSKIRLASSRYFCAVSWT
jgi:hypothetical protein